MLRAVRHLVLVSSMLLLVVSGCAYGEIRHVLRAEFANELDCPEVKIRKKGFAYLEQDPDAERYLLTGCGVTRTYTCPPDQGLVSYDDSGCSWVEGDADRQQYEAPDTAGGEASGETGGETGGDEGGPDAFDDAEDAPSEPE